MLSVSSLIDFLMSLLRDDELRAEFDRAPDEVLARHGLDGVTAEDVRDAEPLLADVAGVRLSHSGAHSGAHSAGGGDGGDVATAIRHVVAQPRPEPDVVVHNVQQTTYNEHHHEHVYNDYRGAVIDSYNQDNDFVDNKGGEIEDSQIAGRDVVESGNDVEVQDSFNQTGVPESTPEAPEPTPEPTAQPFAEFTQTPDDPYELAPPGAPPAEDPSLEAGEL
jgi:hypothetical protein